MITVNIFSSVNKIVLTSFDEYFSPFRMAEFCMAVRSTQLWSEAWPSLSTNISQSSVATHLKSDGIFYHRFTIHLLLSLSVKEY